MLPSLLSLLWLGQLAQVTVATNTTTNGCPSYDTTPCNYRSVWSILGSCALTLLICVWHAIHPDLTLDYKPIHVLGNRLILTLVAFFIPELLVAKAFAEWHEAKEIKKKFDEKGYGWWTVTHSYFMIMGGFTLHKNEGIEVIYDEKLLSLLQKGDILNPQDVTKEDIMDKSTSDGLAKAIFVVQLLWFVIQLIVRLANHLSATLVELDTVCMAILTVALLSFWWEKPCCPQRPYIFYHRNLNNSSSRQEMLEEKQGSEGPSDIPARGEREWSDFLSHASSISMLLLTWAIFGALHATAWNYAFPTDIERIFWRVASLALTGAPFSFLIASILAASDLDFLAKLLMALSTFIGIIARICLVALMLASLRSLPASAHEIVLWTQYIPHL